MKKSEKIQALKNELSKKSLAERVNNYTSKLLRIEGTYEVWGFYINEEKVKERKLLIPFNER
jgi:hypothetical protein